MGRSTKPVRVVEFSARLDKDGVAKMRELAYIQNRLRNKFVEIFRESKEEYWAICRSLSDEYDAMFTAGEQMEAELRERYAERDEMKGASQELSEVHELRITVVLRSLKENRERRKSLWLELKGTPEFKARAEAINEKQELSIKRVRSIKNSYLQDGDYNRLERDARKAAGKNFKSFKKLPFVRIEDTLQDIVLTHQVKMQAGKPVPTISSFFRDGRFASGVKAVLERLENRVVKPSNRNAGKRIDRSRYKLSLDAGYDMKGGELSRNVISAEFELHKGRSLGDLFFSENGEDDATVKLIEISLCKQGEALKAHVRFALANDCYADLSKGNGAVAFDIGWHRHGNGELHTASWRGSNGLSGEILLPASFADKIERSRCIRSLIDVSVTEQTKSLASFRTGVTCEWFLEFTKSVARWRSPRRLNRLFELWRTEGRRFDGDGEAFASLEEWVKRYRHLNDYSAGLRRGAERNRNDIYKNIASRLASRYAVAVFENMNGASMSSKKKAKKTNGMIERVSGDRTSQRQRAYSAPFLLRDIVENAFGSDTKYLIPAESRLTKERANGHSISMGLRFVNAVRVPPQFTSITCAVCGADVVWDDGRIVTCDSCGRELERELNASENILARGLAFLREIARDKTTYGDHISLLAKATLGRLQETT